MNLRPLLVNPRMLRPGILPAQVRWSNRLVPISRLAVFGDSITNQNSSSSYTQTIGTSTAGVVYHANPALPSPHLLTVAHVTAGINTPLSVAVSGNAITVNLATNGSGVATSTALQVADIVDATPASRALVEALPLSVGGGTAIASIPVFFRPVSHLSMSGYATVAQMLLRQRFELVQRMSVHTTVTPQAGAIAGDYDFGYSGYTASELINNPGPLGDLLAVEADTVLVLAGTNGAASLTPTQNRDNIVAIWDALRAAGRRVIGAHITWQNTVHQANITTTNALLETAAAARGMQIVTWGDITGLANFPDGTHPGNLGGQRLALRLSTLLDPLVQPTPPAFLPLGDSRWITANPYMTGGTTTATNWTINAPSGGTVTPSKVAAVDGSGDWQQIVVNQAAYGFQGTNAAVINVGTRYNVGDTIIGVCDFEGDPTGWDFRAIKIQFTFTGAAGGIVSSNFENGSSLVNSMTASLDPFSGILRTAPVKVPTGTTSIGLTLSTFGKGTIRFRRCGVVNLST